MSHIFANVKLFTRQYISGPAFNPATEGTKPNTQSIHGAVPWPGQMMACYPVAMEDKPRTTGPMIPHKIPQPSRKSDRTRVTNIAGPCRCNRA